MYTVSGYNDMCEDFSRTFDSLYRAALFFVRRERIGMYVQFIEGVTPEQKARIEAMC